MGRPLPGFSVALLDPLTGAPAEEGEICLSLDPRPLGLMVGYRDDADRTAEVMRDGYYHTGDVARRDEEGHFTYVGRADDVFKASDYRISPFELESVLLEHPAVAEAAVVPSPDPMRLAVPKAYITLAAGHVGDRSTAFELLKFARESMAAYKRIRRLEFTDLPKTISGKIRRVELRGREQELRPDGAVDPPGTSVGYVDTYFPELLQAQRRRRSRPTLRSSPDDRARTLSVYHRWLVQNHPPNRLLRLVSQHARICSGAQQQEVAMDD